MFPNRRGRLGCWHSVHLRWSPLHLRQLSTFRNSKFPNHGQLQAGANKKNKKEMESIQINGYKWHKCSAPTLTRCWCASQVLHLQETTRGDCVTWDWYDDMIDIENNALACWGSSLHGQAVQTPAGWAFVAAVNPTDPEQKWKTGIAIVASAWAIKPSPSIRRERTILTIMNTASTGSFGQDLKIHIQSTIAPPASTFHFATTSVCRRLTPQPLT